jgi:DNA primase
MGGYISRSFIHELINRVDLVDLIDSYLSLRKTGQNYIAICPFHHEKTPSFTVNPEKQFYYCFGCGAQGNAISFLMNYANFDFVEAVHELAARIGIEVLYEQDNAPVATTSAAKVNLYDLLAQVAKYYQQQLRQSQDAINYLKQRGLTGEIARDFGLGYAPSGWNNLITTFGNTLEAKTHLLATGLIKTNAKWGYYDQFRQRIMFPIVDGRGRVIAFGGRLLHDNSSGPKYLNSPETRLFQKGQELYGWYGARQTRPLPYLVVVEGYLDVITLAQYGVKNVVATLGTAVTREHLTRLFRVVPEIRFCFDGDAAGKKAAWRTLERVLPFLQDGQQVSFVLLPPGQDPDSLLRQQGKATWESCLQQASPLSNFLFATLRQQVDLNYLDGKTRLVKLAKPLLEQLPAGGYYQLLMIQELSKLTQIDAQRLTNDLNAAVEFYPPKPSIPKKTLREYSLVEQAIIYLLYDPTLSQYVEYPNEELASLPDEHLKLFLQLIELTKKDPKITLGVIYEYWRGTEYENVINQLGLISQGEHTNLHLIDVEQEFKGTMARLHEEYDKQSQIIYLTKKLANNHLKITTELKNNS